MSAKLTKRGEVAFLNLAFREMLGFLNLAFRDFAFAFVFAIWYYIAE